MSINLAGNEGFLAARYSVAGPCPLVPCRGGEETGRGGVGRRRVLRKLFMRKVWMTSARAAVEAGSGEGRWAGAVAVTLFLLLRGAGGAAGWCNYPNGHCLNYSPHFAFPGSVYWFWYLRRLEYCCPFLPKHFTLAVNYIKCGMLGEIREQKRV